MKSLARKGGRAILGTIASNAMLRALLLRAVRHGKGTTNQKAGSAMLSLAEIALMKRNELEASCRALAMPVYLGDHTALCRIFGKYKFYVDTRDSGFASNILLDGYWEIWLTQFMARRVKPGMIVVDIGANYGYYTLLLAGLVGRKGRVYAVEPNPHAAALLSRSVALNGFGGQTSIVQAAADERDGRDVLLFVPPGEPKNARIIRQEIKVVANEGIVHHVPTRSVDSIVSESDRLDFIKIDAEGAEEKIIAGMLRTIERYHPAMVLEFNAARYGDAKNFLSFLKELYGTIRYVDYSGKASPVSSTTVLTENFGEDWLLFLARD